MDADRIAGAEAKARQLIHRAYERCLLDGEDINTDAALTQALRLAEEVGKVKAFERAVDSSCGTVLMPVEHQGKRACFDDHDENGESWECEGHRLLDEAESALQAIIDEIEKEAT